MQLEKEEGEEGQRAIFTGRSPALLAKLLTVPDFVPDFDFEHFVREISKIEDNFRCRKTAQCPRVSPTRRTISASISALTIISPLPLEWISPSLLNFSRKCKIRDGVVPTKSAKVS